LKLPVFGCPGEQGQDKRNPVPHRK
jgi:hypothetical protein